MKFDSFDFWVIVGFVLGFGQGYWWGRWGRFFRKRRLYFHELHPWQLTPQAHIDFLRRCKETDDVEPRLHSFDATGDRKHVYVIWPGGNSYYYVREDGE